MLSEVNKLSFCYNGKPFDQTDIQTERILNGNQQITVYRFPDGLKVTNVFKKTGDAYEWANWFENTAKHNSGVISQLWDCDVVLPMAFEDPTGWTAQLPDPDEMTMFLMPQGSIWHYDEFSTDAHDLSRNRYTNQLRVGEEIVRNAFEGLSSGGNAPFFNIHKQGKGYICAIGWTGQWHCKVKRGEWDVSIRTGIEDAEFYLKPGEKFRTASMVIMPYEGSLEDSHNQWRRLVRDHYSLIGSEGRDAYGPLCAGIWGGMRSSSVLDRIHTIQKYELPFEYIWMDAGWYGGDTKPSPDEYEGDWPHHTGDWRISPLIHPGGLKDVTKAVHGAGMKFLLWFEPERVRKSMPVGQTHPEYFLTSGDPDDPDMLLNLGDPAAWQYCVDTISSMIEEIGIDCYRQDFNFTPLNHWNRNDAEGRRGISQILHINGLYRFWDAILERFPHLIIDNCSGGGRRIDIEMMRRSIPLWRTDYMCPSNFPVEAIQCHHMSFNQWMSCSGTGCGRIYDTYRVRSCYDTAMTTNFSYSERNSFGDDPEKMQWLKKHLQEYLKVRPYFSGDLYPLTKVSASDDVWSACQFNRPENNDGIVQIFRRAHAPYDSASFFLRGIDKDATYIFTDLDDDSAVTVSGEELVTSGFKVFITERRKAKIWIYTKC